MSKTVTDNYPNVSVVVTTKNSSQTLEKCLSAVVSQTYYGSDRVEIIVVDNYSTDDTRAIAQRFRAKVLLAGPERTAQVNVGARAATGKYIYWIASDWVLDPALIEEAVSTCEKNGYDAIAIHNVSDASVSFWSRVRKFERDLYVDDPLILTPDFFRRDVYMGVGGFNESLVACEEYELHRRMQKAGYNIGRINAKELHIGEPKNLREIVLKHYYYGKTIFRYVKTDPNDSFRRLSPIRIGFVSNWRNFTQDPIITMGFLVYDFVRYMSVALGVLANT